MVTITRAAAWALLAAITVLSLVPPAWRPVTGVPHGVEHFVTFFAAGTVFALGYRRAIVVLAGAALLGAAAIELLQLWAPGRHARLSDFVVDALGALIGIAIGHGWHVLVRADDRPQ